MANELSERFNGFLDGDDAFFTNLGRSFFNFDTSELKMRSDVTETPKEYQVYVDLPGVDKKNMQINYQDGVLTVVAKRDSFNDQSDQQGNLLASERTYGQVSRKYRFADIDRDKITAKYEDGVLKIDLPKLKEARAKEHRIEIQ